MAAQFNLSISVSENTAMSKNTTDTNTLYKNILYVLSHDLCAPVRQLKAFYDLLITELDAELNDEQLQYKTFIEHSIQSLESKLEIILTASRLYTRQPASTQFNPVSLINGIIHKLEFQHSGIKQSVDIQGNDIDVVFDRAHFSMACEELLANAFKFRHADRELKVAIGVEQTDEYLTLVINDNGIGIEAALLPQVLLPFSRLNGDKYPGLGAGLFLLNTLVQCYGGSLNIDASCSTGCRIALHFPLSTNS